MSKLTFLAMLLSALSAFGQTPDQERDFLQKVEDAFRKHDSKAFLSLYCWDRVNDFMRQQIEEQVADEFKEMFERAEIVPLETNDILGDFTLEGVTYTMNLNPVKRLKLSYQNKNGVTESSIPVGLKNGKFMLTAAALAADTNKKRLPATDDWEKASKLNVVSKGSTFSPVFLEMIARQYLKEHKITVAGGAPILNIIVCDTNKMAQVNFRKADNLMEIVEIGADQKVKRAYELKMTGGN